MQTIESGGINQKINFNAFNYEGEYDYTTKKSGFEFKFNVVTKNDEVRIYILKQPEYGNRHNGGHETHRLWDDSKGSHYICANPNDPPLTVQDALTWLVMWAEGTDSYISTGAFTQRTQ